MRQLADLARLCVNIDREWEQRGRSVAAFPELVMSATDSLELDWLTEPSALAQLLDDPEVAAQQQLSSFSDLYLRLWDNGHFWVELLNWYGSDINIHDHDFSGVQFQVAGRSLNILYGFEPGFEHEGLRFGSIDVREVELWEPGQRSFVRPGRVAAHNVCHLDTPTLSLLIRTHPQPRLGPQWNYFPPGVVGSYGVADAVFRKRVKLLRLLATHDAARFGDALDHFCANADATQTLFGLMKLADVLFEPAHRATLERLIASPDLVGDVLVRAVATHRAMETCKRLKHRSQLTSPQRLALAVMGSAFDPRSCRTIAEAVLEVGGWPGLVDTIASLDEVLPPTDRERLQRLRPLFGLGPGPSQTPAEAVSIASTERRASAL